MTSGISAAAPSTTRSSASPAAPPTATTSFASVADISSDWQATKNVALNSYYGYGWGKSVVGAIYPTNKNIQLGYVELIYRWGITSGGAKPK